jgi:RNA 2',3'-cyclic 3'-phosphodiesterase
MSSPTSVGGDERLRLFLALRLPGPALDGIEAWQRRHLRGVRAVARDHLHLTLAFLGHRPAGELHAIVQVLREAAAGAAADLRLTPSRYRETSSVAMLVFDDEGGRVTAVAEAVQAGLERLGVYRRERRPWLPHVTVARYRRRPGLRLEPPALGTCVPSDAAAYLSRLHPSGAQYEVLESVALGGHERGS